MADKNDESSSRPVVQKPVPLKGKGVGDVEKVHAAWNAHKREQEEKKKKKL